MAHLHDDGQYVGDEYMVVDFEDDAEDQLQAARDRNSLDSESDDEVDVVSRSALRLGVCGIPRGLCCHVSLYVVPALARGGVQCLLGTRWAALVWSGLQWNQGPWTPGVVQGVRCAGVCKVSGKPEQL